MTHLQHAQPVLFRHRCWRMRTRWPGMSIGFWTGIAARRCRRWAPARWRFVLPLDPEATAKELGFDSAAPNSIDAVSRSGFRAEFLFVGALLGVHLSRWARRSVSGRPEFGWIDWTMRSRPGPRSCRKKTPVSQLARQNHQRSQ